MVVRRLGWKACVYWVECMRYTCGLVGFKSTKSNALTVPTADPPAGISARNIGIRLRRSGRRIGQSGLPIPLQMARALSAISMVGRRRKLQMHT